MSSTPVRPHVRARHVRARRVLALAVPAIAAAVLIAGCGTGADPLVGSAAVGSKHRSRAAAPATHAITVTTTEFAFAPSSIDAAAGNLKLTLVNAGKVTHELVVLKTDQPAGALKVGGGRVSEAASVGEVSELDAGATRSATLALKPGRYVYVCNIAGHYAGGMRGVLTVR